jgi:hypothetical protein
MAGGGGGGNAKVLIIQSNSAKAKAPVRGFLAPTSAVVGGAGGGGGGGGNAQRSSMSSLHSATSALSLGDNRPPTPPAVLVPTSLPGSAALPGQRVAHTKHAFPTLPPTGMPKRHTVAAMRAAKSEGMASRSPLPPPPGTWVPPSSSSSMDGAMAPAPGNGGKGGKKGKGKQVLMHFG